MEDLLAYALGRHQNYSHRHDGVVDIISVSYPSFEIPIEPLILSKPIVMVLIEKRILQPVSGLGVSDDIVPRLLRLKADLLNEGKQCKFLEIEFNHTAEDRDGLKLLALRSFLRDARLVYGSFKGCILVGSFPEATIVRRGLWAPDFNNAMINGVTNTAVRNYFCIDDKGVTRSDLPLMDLNGNWDTIYQERITKKSIFAWPDDATKRRNWTDGNRMVTSGSFTSDNYEVIEKSWKDVFYIDDAKYDLPAGGSLPSVNRYPAGPALSLEVYPECLNPEISGIDQSKPNPIAMPDIFISRINAKPVAIEPGTQQHVWNIQYNYNPLIERKLLNEYLDMNHRYRTRALTQMKRGLALMTSSDFAGGNYDVDIETIVTPAHFPEPKYVKKGGTVLDYIEFVKQPHLVKAFIAHSDQWGSALPGSYNVAQLNEAAGGPIANTKNSSTGQLTANHASQGQSVDYSLHRTMWQNHKVDQDVAGIFVHGGCLINAQQSNINKPSDDAGSDKGLMAESLLFFLNNVAVVCRNTDYYDFPWDFFAGLTAPKATLGDAYKNIFVAAAEDVSINLVMPDKKRSYCWNLLGDWTLMFNYN